MRQPYQYKLSIGTSGYNHRSKCSLCFIVILFLFATNMSQAQSHQRAEDWALIPQSLTAIQKVELQTIYQLMLRADFDSAEQRLAALYQQAPEVLPLWLSLLTEMERFAQIRALVKTGVVPPLHNSAIIAGLYRELPLPSATFKRARGTLPLQDHFLVTLPRVKVELQGRSYYFVLDTGASLSLITDRVAKKLRPQYRQTIRCK